MAFTTRLAVLICFGSALSFGATWPGYLVDSKCYANMENNKPPGDEDSAADRDRGFEIRYCRPSLKTSSFGLVAPVGDGFEFLNDAGNRIAAGVVATTPKNARLYVSVTGVRAAGKGGKNVIQVETISPPS